MSIEPIIKINAINYLYPKNTKPALKNFTLEIQPGEIFGLLGPNGSGKSTLLKILSTMIPPQEGDISILGENLRTQAHSIRQKIGVVFQYPALDKKLTVEENLIAQGSLYGLQGSRLKKRVDEVLSVTGLSNRRGTLVEKLSGGLARRAEIAKGLIHHPKILILDEPSTGLDPGAKIDLWRHLNELSQTLSTTIIATTHLMDEAEKCSRLGLINEGSLVALGTPHDLKNKIGGDIISFICANPNELKNFISTKFSLEAGILDDSVRLERERGHELIPQIVGSYPGTITSVTLSKPTLEDVFIHFSGHRFWRQEIS